MSLTAWLRSAWRNWWLLVLCAAVAGIATYILTNQQTREYESTLRLAVGPSPAITRQTRIAQTVDSLNKRALITTFAEIVGGRRIYREAVADTGVTEPTAADYTVSSNAIPEANVIRIAVRGPDSQTAETLVTAIAERAEPFIEDFYKNFSVRQLDDPQTPADPVSPRPVRDASLAVAGGLALGFFLGLCRDRFTSPRTRKARDAEARDEQ